MRDEAEYYRSVLDNLTGGFLSVDLAGQIAYINPTAARILRLRDVTGMIGQPVTAALDGYPRLLDIVRRALETRQTVQRAEVDLVHADVPMTIGYSTLQVKTRAGECLGIGVIFQDLTLHAGKKLVG